VKKYNGADLLKHSLTQERSELLHLLSYQAAMLRMPLYLVGGVVRDILLGRSVNDFDLVVEGSSAEFAEYIVRKFGGKILIHSKFMTATWILNESIFKRLNVPAFNLPDASLSFDLVSARSETYAQPGALPTVKRSTIDDDLRRRDFTINAMALRLDGEHFGELFDPLDGQKDLENKLIRVLHAKSFVDDPTRIFRAVRYAGRYGFEIEAGTLSLINDEARGILSGLSGERLRHEIDLMFEEENASAMLERSKELGLLNVIHSSLMTADSRPLIALIDKPEQELGDFAVPDMLSFRQTLGWVLYLLNLAGDEIEVLAKRLTFPTLLTKAVRGASSLDKNLSTFMDWKPSQWTFHLDEIPTLAVYAVHLVSKDQTLSDYLIKWRFIKPNITGTDLKNLGLEPGPRYAVILRQLRAAWLDGDVKTEEEENIYLNTILQSKVQ